MRPTIELVEELHGKVFTIAVAKVELPDGRVVLPAALIDYVISTAEEVAEQTGNEHLKALAEDAKNLVIRSELTPGPLVFNVSKTVFDSVERKWITESERLVSKGYIMGRQTSAVLVADIFNRVLNAIHGEALAEAGAETGELYNCILRGIEPRAVDPKIGIICKNYPPFEAAQVVKPNVVEIGLGVHHLVVSYLPETNMLKLRYTESGDGNWFERMRGVYEALKLLNCGCSEPSEESTEMECQCPATDEALHLLPAFFPTLRDLDFYGGNAVEVAVKIMRVLKRMYEAGFRDFGRIKPIVGAETETINRSNFEDVDAMDTESLERFAEEYVEELSKNPQLAEEKFVYYASRKWSVVWGNRLVERLLPALSNMRAELRSSPRVYTYSVKFGTHDGRWYIDVGVRASFSIPIADETLVEYLKKHGYPRMFKTRTAFFTRERRLYDVLLDAKKIMTRSYEWRTDVRMILSVKILPDVGTSPGILVRETEELVEEFPKVVRHVVNWVGELVELADFSGQLINMMGVALFHEYRAEVSPETGRLKLIGDGLRFEILFDRSTFWFWRGGEPKRKEALAFSVNDMMDEYRFQDYTDVMVLTKDDMTGFGLTLLDIYKRMEEEEFAKPFGIFEAMRKRILLEGYEPGKGITSVEVGVELPLANHLPLQPNALGLACLASFVVSGTGALGYIRVAKTLRLMIPGMGENYIRLEDVEIEYPYVTFMLIPDRGALDKLAGRDVPMKEKLLKLKQKIEEAYGRGRIPIEVAGGVIDPVLDGGVFWELVKLALALFIYAELRE